MDPFTAWQQGGAVGLLVFTWGGITYWQARKIAALERENRELIAGNLAVLAKLQERDAERLRALEEAERRRREAAS